MSDTYLKVILISAVGGLYLIAYSLFYVGTQVYSGESISIVYVFCVYTLCGTFLVVIRDYRNKFDYKLFSTRFN